MVIDPVLRALYAAAYLAALQPPELPVTTRAPVVRVDTPARPPIVPLRGAQPDRG